MGFIVGVTTGTAKRTFAGDFDRQKWSPAAKNISPGVEYFQSLHAFPLRLAMKIKWLSFIDAASSELDRTPIVSI
jgi:hypothetical protein